MVEIPPIFHWRANFNWICDKWAVKIVTSALLHIFVVAQLVISGNIQQVAELCAGSGVNITTDNILQISQKCIGVSFNRQAIIGGVGGKQELSKLDFDEAEKQPLGQLLAKLKMRKTNFHEFGGSIRELLVMSSAPSGFLLSAPIKELVNISNLHIANLTIVDILGKGRSKFNMNETSDIQLLFAWANLPVLPQHSTLRELAARLGQKVESIGKFSLGEILSMVKAMTQKPFGVKLPISQLLVVCNLTNSMSLELKTISDRCIKDDSLLNILGYPKIKSFNVLEVYKLSGGKISLTNMPNFLGIVDITNKGFDKIIQMTAEPLVLLARGKNISLAQLKNQSMETTLMQIFDADKQIIRKVFSDIDEEIYKLVSLVLFLWSTERCSGTIPPIFEFTKSYFLISFLQTYALASVSKPGRYEELKSSTKETEIPWATWTKRSAGMFPWSGYLFHRHESQVWSQ